MKSKYLLEAAKLRIRDLEQELEFERQRNRELQSLLSGRNLDAQRASLEREFGGLNIHEIARLCGKPDDEFIGRDDLPHKRSGDKDLFQYWVSLTGDRFHARKGCNREAVYPCNAADVGDRTPCNRCKPRLPNLAWHAKYLAVIRQFEDCGLPHPPVHIEK